ncbi:hypothetical protein EJB05_25083, partial [Eragrostis curvula]
MVRSYTLRGLLRVSQMVERMVGWSRILVLERRLGASSRYARPAVKKIGNAGKADANLEKEFEAEVKSLGGLRHRRRRGQSAGAPLDWSTIRLRIAVDVATGLYMHQNFTRPFIHRNVKCSNILLDRGFRAKIADFGLARVLAKSGESEWASTICGTFGYMPPGHN